MSSCSHQVWHFFRSYYLKNYYSGAWSIVFQIGLANQLNLFPLKQVLIVKNQHVYFLKIGFINLLYCKKFLVIMICNLLVNSGNNSYHFYNVNQVCHLPTICRPIDKPNSFTIPLNRYCIAILVLLKMTGIWYQHHANFLWTPQSIQ